MTDPVVPLPERHAFVPPDGEWIGRRTLDEWNRVANVPDGVAPILSHGRGEGRDVDVIGTRLGVALRCAACGQDVVRVAVSPAWQEAIDEALRGEGPDDGLLGPRPTCHPSARWIAAWESPSIVLRCAECSEARIWIEAAERGSKEGL